MILFYQLMMIQRLLWQLKDIHHQHQHLGKISNNKFGHKLLKMVYLSYMHYQMNQLRLMLRSQQRFFSFLQYQLKNQQQSVLRLHQIKQRMQLILLIDVIVLILNILDIHHVIVLKQD